MPTRVLALTLLLVFAGANAPAVAQGKVFRLGYLVGARSPSPVLVEALGWVEGKNVVISSVLFQADQVIE